MHWLLIKYSEKYLRYIKYILNATSILSMQTTESKTVTVCTLIVLEYNLKDEKWMQNVIV